MMHEILTCFYKHMQINLNKMAVQVIAAQLPTLKNSSGLSTPTYVQKLNPTVHCKQIMQELTRRQYRPLPDLQTSEVKAGHEQVRNNYEAEGSSIRLLTKVVPLRSFVVATMKSYFMSS